MNKEIIEKVDELAANGGGKTAIHGYIQMAYGISAKEANEYVDHLSTPRGDNEAREKCVTIMRTQGQLSRKEMVAMIVAECGYTEATANHYVSAIPLCKEWAKQIVGE